MSCAERPSRDTHDAGQPGQRSAARRPSAVTILLELPQPDPRLEPSVRCEVREVMRATVGIALSARNGTCRARDAGPRGFCGRHVTSAWDAAQSDGNAISVAEQS